MREAGDPSQLLKQLEGAGQITGKRPEDLNGMDYSDWGKPVTVTAPPADQVGQPQR